jgi:predicted transcriptional regulator
MRTTTGISLPAELKRAAERQAREEHRSLSSLISFALARYLREVGAWEGHVSGESEEPSGQRGPA